MNHELSTKAMPIRPEVPSLKAYYEMLDHHDWYYSYSDDGGVYRRGSKNEDIIKDYSHTSPEHYKLYSDFCAHYFNGPAWSTVQPPKPEMPE